MQEVMTTRAGLKEIKQPEKSYSTLYTELKQRMKAAGLLDRQPLYYTYKLIEPVVMLAVGFAILFLTDSFIVRLLAILIMAPAYVLLGLIMHDTGHRQIFNSPRMNDRVGLIYANLLLGASISSWRVRHNEHHAHPNELDIDPTLEIPMWAWVTDQIDESNGTMKWILRHQAYTFFPVLAFSGFFQSYAALRSVIVEKDMDDRIAQALALIVHFALYFGALFYLMVWWQALIFFIVHFIVTGLHMGLIFAPNHKGMPIVDKEHEMDFLYIQCMTARNVYPHPIVDYLYGGLNFQIEHHLFPSMSRNNLSKARVICKEFCREYNVPYYETSVIQSYREILTYMNDLGNSVPSNA